MVNAIVYIAGKISAQRDLSGYHEAVLWRYCISKCRIYVSVYFVSKLRRVSSVLMV